ncbi:cellulose binding domain-containing protein [Dactylosporangium sp. CA-092794]|uniref:cellulose binding domain-containing protein n=1 Tax=Dactylosporangium sp. CA-092794 TaxID=3239929 RepID=UPI003D8CBD45
MFDNLTALLRRPDRKLVLGVGGGVLATLLGTAVLVAAFLWPSGPAETPAEAGSASSAGPAPGPATGGGQAGTAGQGLGSISPGASPPASSRPAPGSSGPGAGTSRPAAPVPLTARFAKGADGGLAGYSASIAVANPGTVAVNGWTAKLTLPRNSLSVTEVSGATVTHDGSVWTFVPTADTAQVTGGRTVTVSFRVSGAALLDATPTACTIDGNPCQGL